jgi:hypothetical protein
LLIKENEININDEFLIRDNKMDEFDEKFEAINKKEQEKVAKQKKEEHETEKRMNVISKELKRHHIRIKNKNSELPTFEVEFKEKIVDFNVAWKAGVNQLIRIAEKQISAKRNIKISVGVSLIAIKLKSDEEEEEQTLHAHTSPEAVYSEEAIKTFIKSKKPDVLKRMEKRIEALVGSGWAIKQITGLFITTYTQTPSRGSSYIPTPEKYKNSKCGLINIQNEDELCFRWCLIYHQSEKKEKRHRVSALKKVKDVYDWTGVSFPAGLNDVLTFENNNRVCINIWEIFEEGINPIRLGNVLFVKNDNINLLLVKNEEGKGHYIYIKKTSR